MNAQQEQERFDQMRQLFISNLSHELRTPVAVMQAQLEALNDGIFNSTEEISHAHQMLLQTNLHMKQLLEDLMDISKLQTMEFQMKLDPCNLQDILSNAIYSIQPLAKKNGVLIKNQSMTNDCEIISDYTRIRQLLLIFLDNAVKFSPSGSTVSIELNCSTVPMITIRDTGCGISKEDQAYIFDSFYRADSNAEPGNGLGLAIAQQITQRLDIDLKITSELGSGTCVTLIFPASH